MMDFNKVQSDHWICGGNPFVVESVFSSPWSSKVPRTIDSLPGELCKGRGCSRSM